MRVSLKSLFAAGLAIGVMGSAASAATISASVEQSGIIDLQTTGGSHVLTSGLGYDFTAQNPSQLTTIDSITVQLTVNDGDTGLGEFDRDNLTLGLDGFDTGLKLNDLLNNQIVTITSTSPILNAAAILAALQADGRLVGTVIDADVDGPVGDIIGFPNAQGNIFTFLDITGQTAGGGGGGGGIPLPAAALVAPLGAGLAGMYSRRFRKAK
jgi:hypothetical protein